MALRKYNNSNNSDTDTDTSPVSTPQMTATTAAAIDVPKGLIDMHTGNYRQVMFRDKEITDLITVLNKLDKPNALVIAKPGAGKSALISHLAELIDTANPVLPDNILKSHIYELSLTQLAAGNSLVGQTEQVIEDVIAFATDPANHAIIFIDEVHRLFESNSGQLSQLTQSLKPAMARSDFRFIGATTTGESKTILRDPAIARRIEEVRLHDLTLSETTTIVKDLMPRYRAHHDVIIDDDLAETIVKLADQYYISAARPDNALSLIDQAASLRAVNYHNMLATTGLSTTTLPVDFKTVSKDTLIETINRHTGNAASATSHNLEALLLKHIKGQDENIKDIAKQLTLFRSDIIPSSTPLSLFLAGPTGNGKTQTAKIISKTLFGDESHMTVVNMTEFTNESSLSQLIGSPDGYVGSDSKRITPFDTVYENPSQILLLDEFEKAHETIQQLFYQILEEGFIEDRRGRHIDFSKTILIFTSNALTEQARSVGFGVGATGSQASAQKRAELIASLSMSIPDALLNRMTQIYKYDAISKDSYKEILAQKYNEMVDAISTNRPDMNVEPKTASDEMLNDWVEASYNPALNGRPARGFIKTKLEEATLEAILNNSTDITVK